MKQKLKSRIINIKDVARMAGVSTMTVSRVLNSPELVFPDTRIHVQRVIDQMGYQPNAIARSLKLQQTHVLGLITVDLTDPFFTQVSAGAEQEARQIGYRLMVSSVERRQEFESDIIRLLNERHFDGILVVRDGVEIDQDPLLGLINSTVPIVTTGYHLPHPELEIVDIDNVDGAFQAVMHLIENGHRQIGMITGPENFKAASERTTGYKLALKESGLDYQPDLVTHADWNTKCGQKAMEELLQRGKTIMSAVFVQSDALAIGAMSAIDRAGLRIPEDISLVGFDDLPITEYLTPPLTTVHQPVRELGGIAIRLLVDKINGQPTKTGEVLLKTKLIVRESVAKIL